MTTTVVVQGMPMAAEQGMPMAAESVAPAATASPLVPSISPRAAMRPNSSIAPPAVLPVLPPTVASYHSAPGLGVHHPVPLPSPVPPTQPSLRILVAEDNKVNQKVVLKASHSFPHPRRSVERSHLAFPDLLYFSCFTEICSAYQVIHIYPSYFHPPTSNLSQVLQQICPPGSRPPDVVENGLQVWIGLRCG